MMNLSELKTRRDLLGRIDWEMTPQEAYETFQLKTPEGWRRRGASDSLFFCIDVWAGEKRLLLIHRTMLDSEELAEIEAPAALLEACLAAQAGSNPSKGKHPLDQPLADWLKAALEI